MNKQAIEALKAELENLSTAEDDNHTIIVHRIDAMVGCSLEEGEWECLYGHNWEIIGMRVHGLDITLASKIVKV